MIVVWGRWWSRFNEIMDMLISWSSLGIWGERCSKLVKNESSLLEVSQGSVGVSNIGQVLV